MRNRTSHEDASQVFKPGYPRNGYFRAANRKTQYSHGFYGLCGTLWDGVWLHLWLHLERLDKRGKTRRW